MQKETSLEVAEHQSTTEYHDPTDNDRPPLVIDTRWHSYEENKLIKRYLACHHTIHIEDEDAEPGDYINSIHDSREELHLLSAAPIGQAAQDGHRPLYEHDTGAKKRRINTDSASGSILMEVLGTSYTKTHDLTPTGQQQHSRSNNHWSARSSAPITGISTIMDTDTRDEDDSTAHEEDYELHARAEEAKEKSPRDNFLKTPTTNTPTAPKKTKQTPAPNAPNTKTSAATTTLPGTVPMTTEYL